MLIIVLELLAMSLGVKNFGKRRINIEILIRTDSSTAMAYINHLRGLIPVC